MPDVFLSYARADESHARRLSEALESRGWSVFWDRRILDGKDFSLTIQQALDDARCIVVLWSRTSVASRFVRDEATEGINGRLVPALIEAVKQPLGFRQIQAADLSDWQGLPAHEEFQRLVRSIEAIVHPSSAATAVETPPALPASAPDSPPPTAFISYAPEDVERVEAFLNELESRGIRVWRDKEDLRAGEHWNSEMLEVIHRFVDYVIIFQTPTMTAQTHGLFSCEIRAALQRQAQMGDDLHFLIPVTIGAFEPLPSLKPFQPIDVGTPGGVDLLVESIEQDWKRRARSKLPARATTRGVPSPGFSRYLHQRSRVPVVLAATLVGASAVAFMWVDTFSTDPPVPPQKPTLRVGPGPPQVTLSVLSDPPGRPAPNPAVERLRRTNPAAPPRSTNVTPGVPMNTAPPSATTRPDVPSERPSLEKPPPSVSTRAADHQAIEATLQQFVAAYEDRDPEALRRIWPSMTSSTAKTLREATSYQLELRDKAISIDGDRAIVTCRRLIVHQPGSGVRRSTQPLTTITLRKETVGWFITGVR